MAVPGQLVQEHVQEDHQDHDPKMRTANVFFEVGKRRFGNSTCIFCDLDDVRDAYAFHPLHSTP